MKVFLHLLVLGAVGFGSTATLASPTDQTVHAETEDEVLARVLHELEAIDHLIVDASNRADEGAVSQLDYPALRHDLRTIRLGIEEFLLVPRNRIRAIPPLRGVYR
ncbi:MAG: RAQPRD family integrative conjugative element protein [Gammaproteobacteria bacterium]|nr:RAQPRD family integrative conjugative element protein [Gammaproteobacteria bacterium]MCP5135396.1 RAQPRD family integrative conjugative element protein [Gammaproteobacteria bacterium]